MDETQGESQSQFFVEPEKPLYSDVGVQADVQKPTSKTPEENKELVDENLLDTQDITATATGEENVEKPYSKLKSELSAESGHGLCSEGQLPSDNSEISSSHVESPESSEKEIHEMKGTNAERSCSRTEKIESDRSAESGHDSGPCSDSEQPSNNSDISNDELIQVESANTFFRQESFLEEEHIVEDDEAVYDAKEDEGIQGLKMLMNPKIDKEDGNADGFSVSDGDGDDDDSDYSDGTLDEYEAHEGKSAFDKLRELLS